MNKEAAREVRAFIRSLLDELGDPRPFADDEALFENARLDSMALMQLTVWLEQRFGLDFGRLELHLGHFESVNRIVALVEEGKSQSRDRVVGDSATPPNPTTAGEQNSVRRFWWLGLLTVVGAIWGLHLVAAWLEVSPVRNGGRWDMLWDVDSYLWLHWVQALADGAPWQERMMARVNAPYGYESHWTLPYALVLYVGAALGSLFTDFSSALWGWGVINGVVTHLLIFALLAWSLRRQLDAGKLLLLLLLFLSLRGIFHQTAIGQADHHALLLLLLALGLVLLLELAKQYRARWALIAGMAAALAVWVSVEGLLHLFATFIVLWCYWLMDHRRCTRAMERAALGALLVLLIGVALERSPADWLSVEYDRLSIVHVQLVALLWAGCAALGLWCQRRPTPPALGAALGGSLVLGAGLLGVIVALYPGLINSPHPWLEGAVWEVVEGIQDEQPYLPNTPYNALGFVIDMTPAWWALGYCVWELVRRWRRNPREIASLRPLLALLVYLLVFGAFALWRFRGLGYLHLVVVVPWFWLALQLWRLARSGPRRPVAAGLLVLAVAGQWIAAFPLWQQYFAGAGYDWGIRRTPECRMSLVAEQFPSQPQDPSAPPVTVLTSVFSSGQMLLYTDLGILNAPYHRNVGGIEDGVQLLLGDPEGVASRMVAQQRNLGYVALCTDYLETLPSALLERWPRSLLARVAAGRPPDWLQPMPLPVGLNEQFRLYRVSWSP